MERICWAEGREQSFYRFPAENTDVRPFPISTKESRYFTYWGLFFFWLTLFGLKDRMVAEKWGSLFLQVRSGPNRRTYLPIMILPCKRRAIERDLLGEIFTSMSTGRCVWRGKKFYKMTSKTVTAWEMGRGRLQRLRQWAGGRGLLQADVGAVCPSPWLHIGPPIFV